MKKKKGALHNIISIVLILVGCALAAFSIGSVLIPNLIQMVMLMGDVTITL